jgi:hypothetical protein
MINDINLVLCNNQSLAVAGPGAPSQNVLDFTGAGVGQPPPNFFGVTSSVFGQDIGIGDGASPPNILCLVGTTFATGTAATLNVQLQESVDSGVNGTPPYSPNAWTTIAETGVLTPSATVLIAGQKIAEFTIPPRAPGQNFPRFFRLNFVIPNATSFTAGTIGYAGIITGRDDFPAYPAAY